MNFDDEDGEASLTLSISILVEDDGLYYKVDLVEEDDFYYEKTSDIPFTGEVNEGLERGRFENGKRVGPWVTYWENGQLSLRCDYKKGKEEGPWIAYHDNGELLMKGDYKDGKREDYWEFFNEDGTKRFEPRKVGETVLDEGSGTYRDGVKVSD